MSYQPDSPGEQVPPPPVLTAVRLMYLGAVASAAATLATISNPSSGILTANQGSLRDGFHAVEDPSLAVAWIFLGLITISLWIWMARANRAGKNWARITATVFFGFNTLILDINRGDPLVSLLIWLFVWLVGLGAIVQLWRRNSSQYFARAGSEAQR